MSGVFLLIIIIYAIGVFIFGDKDTKAIYITVFVIGLVIKLITEW